MLMMPWSYTSCFSVYRLIGSPFLCSTANTHRFVVRACHTSLKKLKRHSMEDNGSPTFMFLTVVTIASSKCFQDIHQLNNIFKKRIPDMMHSGVRLVMTGNTI